MERSAMPPPFQLQASTPDGNDGGGKGDSLLWLLKFTWEAGDKAAFWRLVEDRTVQILHDPESLQWLQGMNAKGAFAQEADAIPTPLLEMSATQQDHTGTKVPEPRLLELPEVEITAHSLAPPERPFWRLVHRDKNTDYHFAQRGTTFFLVAETAINSGGSAYHYLTFDGPQEWKEFHPKDRNFNLEIQETVTAQLELLQLAEILAEEAVWAVFGEVMAVAELGRMATVAGKGDRLAKKAAKGAARRRLADRTPAAPEMEGAGAMAREGLGESAESVTHTVGSKGAIGQERATRMRTRMSAKVGGNPLKPLKFSDAELADFLSHAEGLGFGEADIEAMLSMKVRIDERNSENGWILSLDTMQEVAESIARKSRNHKIAFKEGWDFMKAYREAQEKMLVQNQPFDPSEYLEDWYIKQHLEDFEEEASYLITGRAYKNRVAADEVSELGRPSGQYISTPEEVTRVLEKAKGDISIVEQELGIAAGSWQNQMGLYRIDVLKPNKLKLRLPNGFEDAANEFWHPGGFTAGGAREAVVNPIPKNPENFRFTRLEEFD